MRAAVALVLVFGMTILANAQRGNPTRPSDEMALQGVEELNFIIGKLKLTEEQQTHAAGLIEEYEVASAQQADMAEFANLLGELQKAKQNNDQPQVDKIMDQVKMAQPATRARIEFLSNIETILDANQKTRLKQILALLESSPTGYPTLMQIFKAALATKPTSTQRIELDRNLNQFRNEEVALIRRPSDVPSAELGQKFAAKLRAVLDAPRQSQFDEGLKKLLMD